MTYTYIIALLRVINLNRNRFAIGIILLFIISSTNFVPIAFGSTLETSEVDIELERMLDDLRFACITPYGFSEDKYNYYKEQIISKYSSEKSKNDMLIENEIEKNTIQCEKPLKSLSVGPMDSPWPMKCYNAYHTSRSSYSTASNPGVEKWRFYSSGWVNGGIAIDNDGILYFKGAYNALDRYIYAVYPDGAEKWKFKTGGLILGSSPAIAEEGTIYIGSYLSLIHI